MNEIATGMFFWLLKILGAYLTLLVVLTIILSRWKKKPDQEPDEVSHLKKKRTDRNPL
ncbi:hypothetical protein [uncultured Gimesia sp.]|jgi:hypothetical protein|uniref:hypothetical protein n=1 Tax=uncultured Gimesia sp. TaxID=1678688 RepID=UPI002608F677|nr:hypothetical protein [uncultured Gimesia sp.]